MVLVVLGAGSDVGAAVVAVAAEVDGAVAGVLPDPVQAVSARSAATVGGCSHRILIPHHLMGRSAGFKGVASILFPVLAVESLVIFTWGVVTEVKRRAFLGFGGLLAAIVLSAVIPVNYQLRSGIDVLGTVLAIGMPSAVVLIATAAAIEKYRDRIGFAVRRVVEVVNGWE